MFSDLLLLKSKKDGFLIKSDTTRPIAGVFFIGASFRPRFEEIIHDGERIVLPCIKLPLSVQ